MRYCFTLLSFLLIGGCEPFVTEFSDSSTPLRFEASNVDNGSSAYQGGGVKVLTWNMRFGIGRFSFFGDSCGEGVIADEETVADVKLIFLKPTRRPDRHPADKWTHSFFHPTADRVVLPGPKGGGS